MAIALVLAESTPNRLRYIATDDAQETVTPSAAVISNATLQADAIPGTQMAALVATAVADQDAARALLAGEGLTAAANIDTARAHLKVTPRSTVATMIPWAVDADAVGNLPVVNVYGPNLVAAAYIDIEFEHTYTR